MEPLGSDLNERPLSSAEFRDVLRRHYSTAVGRTATEPRPATETRNSPVAPPASHSLPSSSETSDAPHIYEPTSMQPLDMDDDEGSQSASPVSAHKYGNAPNFPRTRTPPWVHNGGPVTAEEADNASYSQYLPPWARQNVGPVSSHEARSYGAILDRLRANIGEQRIRGLELARRERQRRIQRGDWLMVRQFQVAEREAEAYGRGDHQMGEAEAYGVEDHKVRMTEEDEEEDDEPQDEDPEELDVEMDLSED